MKVWEDMEGRCVGGAGVGGGWRGERFGIRCAANRPTRHPVTLYLVTSCFFNKLPVHCVT